MKTMHSGRQGSAGKHVFRVWPQSVLLALALLMANAEMALVQAGGDVSRYNSWTTPHVSNYHGTVGNPNATVWSYYRISGNTATTTNFWEPMNTNGITYFQKQYDASARVYAMQSSLYTYWNTPTAAPASWKPSLSLAVFKEFGAYHRYAIGGKLTYTLGSTANGYDRTVNIWIARADNSVTNLYTYAIPYSGMTLNTYTNFDESDPGKPVPAALKNFTLRQGDQLVFGIRGSSDPYRQVNLGDGALTLTITGPAGTVIVIR